MKIHKYWKHAKVLLIISLLFLLLTGCTEEPYIIKKTTINNIEDNCPNDNMTYCNYIVTSPNAEVNISLVTQNSTEINISVEQL